MRQHQLHAGGLQVMSQHGNSRIAPGDEHSIAKIVGRVEDLDVRAAVFRKLTGNHGVADRKIPRNRRRRRGDQALIYAAELHRLAWMQRFRARQQRRFFRAETGGFGLGKREKIFHLHFESLRQP